MEIQWRPYQIACKKAIKENYNQGITEQLIVQATGTGKRLQAVDLSKHFKRTLFIAHREELIQQAQQEIELLHPFQTGIVKGKRFEINKKIVVASVQTLYNRLDKINPDTFDLVIIDECFVAGTKVNGINIEDYRQGWPTTSFNHKTGQIEQSIVTRVMKRKYSGKLYDFGNFKCTPNHPIFIVGIGYCLAKEIQYAYLCNKVMRYATKLQSYLYKLRNSFRSKDTKKYLLQVMRTNKTFQAYKSGTSLLFELRNSNDSGKFGRQEKIHELSPTRIWLLFRKMQKGILQQDIFDYYEQYEQKICFRKNEEKKSNVQSRIIEQNESINDWSNLPKSRWKWTIDKATNYYCGSDSITNGISNISKESNVIGKESSEMLQSRFGLSRSKISNRDRWKDASIEALEILRQTKDGYLEKSRLEYIKIYKPTSKPKSTEDCKENYVHNIEVKGNNNYFANSILVHNCHHYISPTFLTTLRHFTPKLKTVWTATPKRLDGLSLSNIAQKIVFEYRIQDGIKEGFLAPIVAYQVKTMIDISKVKKTAGDFNMGELSVAIDTPERNQRIVDKYIEYAHGMQGIAFCVDIDHAHNLLNKFAEKGITAAAVSSDEVRCPNRAELIQKFKNKEIQVLTNVNILTEGFDYPDIGIIMMGRPTQSEVLYTQCLDNKTEILTNNGWKTNNTIANNDKSAAFNIHTREIKYLSINEIHKRRRGPDEPMYSVSLPGIDIRVTGGHRMIQSKRINKKRIFTKNCFINASDFANNTDLVKVPVSGYKIEKGLPLTEWELKFLGLFLSNGSYNKKTKQVYIAQSKHQKWNLDIVQILNNCGFEYTIKEVNRVTNYSESSTMLYYYISNKYTKHLLKFIDKNLNKNYEKIEPYQLNHLIYGINLGDGNKTTSDWKRHTFTISIGNYLFAENLQKLCIFNGFRCNIASRINEITKTTSWQLHITPNKFEKSLSFGKSDKRQKFSREEYFKEEDVWCISNDWKTIITRRNGKIVILGNCIGRGTRLKTKAFREKFETEACIILDFVDNTGRHSLVNAYELEKDKPIEERLFLPVPLKEKLLEERERRERKMKETYGSDKMVDLLKLPEVRAWHSEKMLEPATEKQIKWLQDIGLWQENAEYTKLQANEIISNLPAKMWMIRFLASQGYDVRGTVTLGQYQKVKFLHDRKNKFKIGS